MIPFAWIIGQCLLYLRKKQGIAPDPGLYLRDITHHLLSQFHQKKPRRRIVGNIPVLFHLAAL